MLMYQEEIMEYLKSFDLTLDDINDILRSIDDQDKLEFDYNEDKIKKIIKYFISKKITNIKDLIINRTYIFYEDYNKLKSVIDKLSKEQIDLINRDASNLIV